MNILKRHWLTVLLFAGLALVAGIAPAQKDTPGPERKTPEFPQADDAWSKDLLESRWPKDDQERRRQLNQAIAKGKKIATLPDEDPQPTNEVTTEIIGGIPTKVITTKG